MCEEIWECLESLFSSCFEKGCGGIAFAYTGRIEITALTQHDSKNVYDSFEGDY